MHEFIVFGFPPELARRVLSDRAQRARDIERFPANVGLEVVLPGMLAVLLVILRVEAITILQPLVTARRRTCVRCRSSGPMGATSSRGRTATTKRFARARSSSICSHEPEGAAERLEVAWIADLRAVTVAHPAGRRCRERLQGSRTSRANRMICKSFPDGRESCFVAHAQQ